MGRLDERLGAAPVSRFDLVAEPSNLKKNVKDNELSLEEWYACCRSPVPQAASHDFFCRVWPDVPLHPSVGLRRESSTHQNGERSSADQTGDDVQREDDVAPTEAPEAGSHRGSSGHSDASQRLLTLPRVMGAVRCLHPVYVSRHTRDAQHELACFTPGTQGIGAVTEETIERGEQPLESDAAAAERGRPSKPRLLRRNRNKLVNRLWRQGNTGWSLSGSDEGYPLVADLPTEDVLFKQHQARDVQATTEPQKPLMRFVEATGRDASLSLLPACTVHLLLKDLTFDHHPLLAAEHLVAHRLTAAVSLYNDRIAKGHTELLLQKVKVLRTSLSRLGDDEPPTSTEASSSDLRGSVVRRAELYRTSLTEARKQLHASGLRDRQLLTEAISSWTELKELRQTQGYVVTPWVLNIKKAELQDPEAERRWWKEAQAVEVEERLQEEEVESQRRDLEYQQQLQQWKQLRAEKKAARRRLHLTSAGAADTTSQLTTADELSLASPLPPKPQPPVKPLTREEVTEQVRSTFKKSLRPPGEPELQLLLSECPEVVTASKLCPLQERRRRQAVARTEIAVKIYVNNKPVTQTPWSSLDDHTLKTALEFPVVAATACEPRTLGLQLLQATTSARLRKVLPLDSYTCDLTRFSDLDSRNPRCRHQELDVEFKSDEVFCYSHTGVGAGGDDPQHSSLLTRARLTAHCRLWSGPANAHPLPSVNASDVHSPADKTAPASHVKCSEEAKPASFECDGEACGPAWLCSRQHLDSNLRHQLLRLRQQRAGHLRDMSRIPPLTSQILRASAQDTTVQPTHSPSSSTTQADDVQPSDADDDDWLDDVAEQLAGAQELVSSVRRRLLQRTAEAAAVPTPADMVQEEQIPDIGSLGLSLVSLFRPKRPLKPDRKVRGVVRAGVVSTGRRVALIINVARAFNVPVRDDLDLTSSLGAVQQDQEEDSTPSVRPYVTVSFQGHHARTSVAYGPNPTWNQQLVLPFRPESEDRSSTGLVKENISLQLFDERLLDDSVSSGEAMDGGTEEPETVRARLHNTWLASLCIPTAALLRNTCKIEGTFELSSPVSVLGYRRAVDGGGRGVRGGGGGSTTLTLYVTLEPALPQPAKIDASLLPSSNGSVSKFCKAWLSSLQSRHPQRLFICCSYAMTGQLTSLDRYIAPIPPPSLTSAVEPPEQLQCRVAWFVSLLPALPDMSLLSDCLNITASCDQFVKQSCGGETERAVLLTNIFLHLGYDAYLLLGSSVCEGQLWCTLVRGGPPAPVRDTDAARGARASVVSDPKVTPSWKIWCPSTAKVYSTRDPFCPVKSVYVLANQTNVWGNCQKFDDPARVQYSVQDSSAWRALYGSGGAPTTVPCVQPKTIDYGLPAPHHDKELREKLTLIVRDAFMKWRPLQKTVWNRHACDVLRGLVRRLETPRASGGTAPPPSAPLLRLYQSHFVCGVCVHQGWRGIGPLLAAVRSTAVHSCSLPEAEFALAISTHPYPARATSVWLYIASLVRKTV